MGGDPESGVGPSVEKCWGQATGGWGRCAEGLVASFQSTRRSRHTKNNRRASKGLGQETVLVDVRSSSARG